LRGPDGTRAALSAYRGGTGNNYTATYFDDQAATPIAKGRAPFWGPFRPDHVLTGFDGRNARGTWTLLVWDGRTGNVGRINSWALTIKGSATTAVGAPAPAAPGAEGRPEPGPQPEAGGVTFAAGATADAPRTASSLVVMSEADGRGATAWVAGPAWRQTFDASSYAGLMVEWRRELSTGRLRANDYELTANE
jgi:hypothetical protein